MALGTVGIGSWERELAAGTGPWNENWLLRNEFYSYHNADRRNRFRSSSGLIASQRRGAAGVAGVGGIVVLRKYIEIAGV